MRAVNWSRFTAPAGFTQTSAGEWHGPCPVTGDGKDTAWLNVGAQQPPSCRKCGDGSGRITGDVLAAHARAFGIWDDVDLGSASKRSRKVDTWIWTAPDGRTREQYRWENGKKTWQPTEPENDPPPRDLLFLPDGIPTEPVIYLCEGASDVDAVRPLGLAAIGRTNARPSPPSLARLHSGSRYLIWPDHDTKDHAGYRQALTWHRALTAAGLEVDILDPLELQPDAPSGYDARDWAGALPADTTAAAAGARLAAAVVNLDTIKGRVPGGAMLTAGAPAVAPLEWQPPADGLPIPRQFIELCDSEEGIAIMIAERAAGRLRCIGESGEWLYFTAGDGWRPVPLATVEECLADCARRNIGGRDKGGNEIRMRPASAGRKAVGRAVAGLLAGRPEVLTTAADWDAAHNLIVLPGGDLLDVLTGARQRPSVDELHRRRVSVEPARPAEFAASKFRRVIEHAVPDSAERIYLQRRLGAALVDAEGMDDLLWLFGPPGCGKGTLVRALEQTLGDYAAGVPINELLLGMNKSHPAWLARTAGCRLLIGDDLPVGHYIDDATINMLLGSEITAHHMRCRPFDFRLQAPLLCTSNAPPQITSTNVRRLRPIQCGAEVRQPDPQVRAAMSSGPEVAACLRWLLDGAAGWHRAGCPVPTSIRERADDAAEYSPIAEFTAMLPPGERIESGEVYRRWCEYKSGRGERAGSHRAMVGKLRGAGWEQPKPTHGKRYLISPAAARGSLGIASAVKVCTRDVRADHAYIEVNSGSDPKRSPISDFPANIGVSEPAPEPPRGVEPDAPLPAPTAADAADAADAYRSATAATRQRVADVGLEMDGVLGPVDVWRIMRERGQTLGEVAERLHLPINIALHAVIAAQQGA